MLSAVLCGKLSVNQENMEDILTSLVFGCFKYIDVNEGLMPFISYSVNQNKELLGKSLVEVVSAEFVFWPRLHETGCIRCEPDVLIHLYHKSGLKSVVLIEAKYHSLKSSYSDDTPLSPPTDQLAREWHNLFRYSERNNATPYLVYVTQDYGFPINDIEDAQDELRSKGVPKGDVYWTSWRFLPRVFQGTNNPFLSDLIDAILNKYEFTLFDGISVEYNHLCRWEYRPKSFSYEWTGTPTTPLQWRYGK